MATLELAIQTTKVRSGASEFINATVQVKGAARSASQEIGGLNSTLNSTGTIAASVSRVVAGLFAGFGAVQGLREAVRTFAEFEQTLASLKGVLEATTSQMDVMKRAALSMGASSRSSANQAAEALLILSKAGFSSKQAIEALPGVLALATAHQLDLGAASDYTANILNQFRLATDQTNRVVDVLSTTANKSLADVRDLAEAMKYAGPAAGALGVSVEEAAAAAGVLSDRGIKASLAGTNLRGILIDLVSPTAKAKDTLAQLGLTVRDVDIRSVGLAGAMQALAKAGAGVDDLAKIFGVLQVSGATALVQNTKRLKELTEANQNASGSTQELVDIMQDTLMGRFKEFINILGVAVIKIGDSGFGKSIKDLLIVLTDAIRLMTGFGDKIVGSRAAAERAADVFKILGAVLGAIVALKVANSFATLAINLAASLKSSVSLVGTMGMLLTTLTAVAALDLGMYLHDEFKIVQQVALETVTMLNKGWEYVRYGWKIMVSAMSVAWDWVIGVIQSAFGTMIKAIADGYEWLGGVIAEIPGMGDWGEDMQAAAQEMGSWGDKLKETAFVVDTFGVKAFKDLELVLNRVLPSVAAALGNEEMNRAVDHLRNVFSGKTGEKIPVDQLLELNKEVQSILSMLEKDGSSQAQFAARRIREEWFKGLAGVGNLPFSIRKGIAGGELTQNLADIDAVRAARLDEINAEFQGKERKGNTYEFGASLSSQLTPLYEAISKWLVLGDTAPKVMEDTTSAVEETVTTMDEYVERVRDLSILNEDAHDSVVSMTKAIQDEAAALSQSQRERNVLVKITQFQTVAEEAYGKETERTTQAVKDYTAAVNALEDARADKKFGEKLRQLKAERDALFLSNQERRVAVEVAKFQADAEQAYGIKSARAAEMTAKYREELEKLTRAEELQDLASNIGDEFGQAFTDIVFGAKSATEAIEGLTKAIIQMVFQQLVAQQLSGWISTGIMGAFGGGSAKGNAFSGGAVVPFATGGIVAGPTTFPMSNGRTGLMGENGPEAIMPLSRGTNGKLGVEVTGHATKNVIVNVSVISNNPNEFRGSERHIAAKMRNALQRL